MAEWNFEEFLQRLEAIKGLDSLDELVSQIPNLGGILKQVDFRLAWPKAANPSPPSSEAPAWLHRAGLGLSCRRVSTGLASVAAIQPPSVRPVVSGAPPPSPSLPLSLSDSSSGGDGWACGGASVAAGVVVAAGVCEPARGAGAGPGAGE